ncbi:MAG: ABC transporter ATP-binding protein [Halothiobacillaceae bacterium]|nr:MAG: ABC transporter ATP-binding protein [Halothiobacillaceae bacterium]
MPVLEVQSIGKAYRDYGGEWRRVLSWFGLPLAPREEHWTLQNISFSIQPGESVGIVGQNGAGKSTLLKLITGTLRPSTGQVTVRGRIAAILELGMGFHPDLTGRQNAYHAAGLMGHSQEQINAVIDDIEAFAEIGEYFDQPVRTYSSGMQMRVAFSVASAIRPDILIIDEALSVGDAYFQHKCFQRIREFKDQDTTLLFVSHDPAAVRTLCNRAILLDHGHLIRLGSPDDVLDYYNALIAHTEEMREIEQAGGITRSGSGAARIVSASISGKDGPRAMFISGEPATIETVLELKQPLEDLTLGILIRDRLGNEVFGTNSFNLGTPLHTLTGAAGERRVAFEIPELNLGPGSYSLTLALHASFDHTAGNYDWWDGALAFEVVCPVDRPFIGVAALPVHMHITD